MLRFISRRMAIKKFLIEIGVEEIPPGVGELISSQLKEKFPDLIRERRISEIEIDLGYTPSRIVIVGKISAKSCSEKKLIAGPSYDVAFKNNKPTPAYFGFLRSQKASEKDVVIQETKKGKYVFVNKIQPALSAQKILCEVFPFVFEKISLPKYMVWDDSSLRFIRPVRWLLALFDDNLLNLKLGKLRSQPYTFIRENGEFKRYKIKAIKDYFKIIKTHGIVLSPEDRRKKIQKLLEKKAKALEVCVYPNFELLSEVNDLVEKPFVISCGFKSQFLKLPEVVLLASMAKYQRVFAVVDKSGKIKNNFLAVLEGKPKAVKNVKKHYEFVLNSRLWDADYFLTQDRKESLESRVPKLSTVLHHQKLGTVWDKVNAMVKMAQKLGEILKFNAQEIQDLNRAAYLCKADLLTKMVYEFPSLEGIMGGIYAQLDGERNEVADAISQHYKPRTNEDGLPSTKLSALLSVIDKLYNVVGFLGLGLVPSGSEDPFTIRRQVQAIVRILIHYQFEIDIENLFDVAYFHLKDKFKIEKEKVYGIFQNLIIERFEVLMREEDISRDLIAAVVKVNFTSPAEVYFRIRKLLRIYDNKEFYMACKVVERTANIIKGQQFENRTVNEDLLQLPEEKKLWNVYLANKDKILTEVDRRNYDDVLILYARTFYDIIHLFFDKVLVNVEDEKLRNNRKVLLYLVNRLVTERVADLKEMEVLKNARS